MLKLILLGWIVGIACMGHKFSLLAQTWWVWGLCAIVLYRFVSRQKAFEQVASHQKAIVIILNIWAVFCLGYHYADRTLEQRLQNKKFHAQSPDVIVYIKKINKLSETGSQQVGIVLNQSAQPVHWLFYLNKQSQPQNNQTKTLQLGDYYRISGQVKPAHSYAVAGAFDQEKWFLQQDIMAAFLVTDIQALSSKDIEQLGYAHYLKQQQTWFARFRLQVEQCRLKFRHMLQKSQLQHKGLILALLTGDESLLSDERTQQFQQLGISHLLAISGPHVLIFACMLTWGLQRLVRYSFPNIYLWQPKQILMLLPFILSVIVYVAFVGFEIPAIRTLMTVILTSIFMLLRIEIKAFSILIYSASLLLLYDPFSILSAAFWLSYGACFILFRIYQTVEQQSSQQVLTLKYRIVFAIKILIESQWKVFLALLPLVLIFFQQISWIAPITNLITIPLLGGLIVPLGIIAACVWLIVPTLGMLLFQLSNLLLSGVISLLAFLQQIAPKLYGVSSTPIMFISLILGLVILFIPRGIVPKFWASICFLPMFFAVKISTTTLTILDVGQGSSAFLQHPQHTLLIDTGGSFNEQKFGIGERVVIPFLRQRGISKLDQVILSHLDQDHSGAFPSIQKAFTIKQVLSNEYNKKMQLSNNFSFCHQGQYWSYLNLKIQILFPHENELANAHAQQNETSCVVYLQFLNAKPYQNFLLMGDAGWETEYKLLQQYPNLNVDVLVLGHHGSKNSSAYDFLATLKA